MTSEKQNFRKQPMFMSKKWKKELQAHSDSLKIGAILLASYIPHIFLNLPTAGMNGILKHLGIVSGIALSMRIPYIKEVPMLLSRAVMRGLIMRKATKAPDSIQKMTDDLALKAGLKRKIKAYVYKGGVTNNAAVLTEQVYIGQELVDNLDDKELRFVLAHELSHIKNHDISSGYLSVIPRFNAFLATVSVVSMTVQAPWISLALFSKQMAVVAGHTAYYYAQTALQKLVSRTQEYRADHEAIQMTGALEPAVTAYRKTTPEYDKKPTWRQNALSSHPIGADRILGLAKAFNKSSGNSEPVTINLKNAQGHTVRNLFIDAANGTVTKRLPAPDKPEPT